MNNQYMPKYLKVKQIYRPDGTVCYLEKDHINAVEDTLLYEDTTIGSKTEKTGTDLVQILKDIADGSASTECKIATISKNGTNIPIDAQKNVNIEVPVNLSDLTEDSTHRTVTDTEKQSYPNKIEKITFNSSEITPTESDKNVILTESDPVFSNWKVADQVALCKNSEAITHGLAIGGESKAENYGVAIGYNAQSKLGLSIGADAISEQNGTAIGRFAEASGNGAVQINKGTNTEANTLKFGNAEGTWNTTIVNSSGKIPSNSLEVHPDTKVDKTTTIAGINLQDNITKDELKNALEITSTSEATDSEVDAGTVATKMVTPNKTARSVKAGLLHNADKSCGGTDLASTDQKKVQTWLGTTQLVFTFSDNTTRTFNFVCNEVV